MALTIINRQRRYRRFLVYDMEWIPGTLEIRCVGVYDGSRYRYYTTVNAFLDGELTHENRSAWFYAHAGGLADIQFVFERIYKRVIEDGESEWTVDAKFSGSSAIIVKIGRHRHRWMFIDSYWLFRDKLANIGKSIGLHKGTAFAEGEDPEEDGLTDDEYERRMHKRREWYATVPLPTLIEYNRRDCEILWHAVDQFETAVLDLGGELQMTIASTGMNLFRRKYLTQEIESHSYVNECSTNAYAASRVERAQEYVENALYFDINSSFPFAMTHPLPGKFLGSRASLPSGDKSIYLADCEIMVPESLNVPPLAYRLQSRVFYPVGKWRNWFSSIDLAFLQSLDGVVCKVHEVLEFEPFTDLGGYCTDLYSRRKKATDPFEKIVYKYLLNCVYGKFAEMTEKDTLLINPEKTPVTLDEAIEMRMHQWMPGAWLKTVTRDIPHRLVPISTHITAIARRTLAEYLMVCRDWQYCDTDGFSTHENLAVSDELGGLKLEKILFRGHFAGSKMYDLEGETPDGKALRLVRGKGMSRLTPSRYAELMEGKAIEMERMSRIRERLGKGLMSPAEAKVKKRVHFVSPWSRNFDAKKHVIPKRFPYPDGSTRPWHVEELLETFKKE